MPSILKGGATPTRRRKDFTNKKVHITQKKNYIERDYIEENAI